VVQQASNGAHMALKFGAGERDSHDQQIPVLVKKRRFEFCFTIFPMFAFIQKEDRKFHSKKKMTFHVKKIQQVTNVRLK
jgi:hypothetical protein